MHNITSFSMLLAMARCDNFHTQQQLSQWARAVQHEVMLVSDFEQLRILAKANDGLAAQLAKFSSIRQLISSFEQLIGLADNAPETLVALLSHSEVRAHILNFNQLLQLLKKVDLLRVTLPPHADVRRLVETPAQLKALARLKISAYSEDNLAQLFVSYTEVRRCFTSLKQLLKFISCQVQTAALFIKDAYILRLVKNAKQLNCFLAELNSINPRWSKNAALAYSALPGIERLFTKPAELTEFLNYLPDQNTIREFMQSQPSLTKLLKINPSDSLLNLDFFQNKSLRVALPQVPCSLLQYA